jgi:hypothetical protein
MRNFVGPAIPADWGYDLVAGRDRTRPTPRDRMLRPVPTGYLPIQFGARFSMNAVRPSL